MATLGNVRGPQDPRSDDARQKINAAMVSLITRRESSFFGIVGTKLQLVEDNINVPTMAVDGKHLFYNVNFLLGCPPDEKDAFRAHILEHHPDATEEQILDAMQGLDNATLKAGIVHEILHCMTGTFIRRGLRNPKKWNMATDFEINAIIKEENIGTLGKSWLFDEKYHGMAAEEIYSLLKDSEGQGDSWDSHYGSMPGDDASGESRGTVRELFNHTNDTQVSDDMEDFKQTCINAAKAAGDVPGGVQRYIQEMEAPKVDWRTKLKRTMQSLIKRDMSFQRPNRRSWNYGVILPGFTPEETIDVAVAIDMSGSITNEQAKDFISEVYGMTKHFPSFKIHLMTFDTRLYNPKDFNEHNVDDLFTYDVAGGGGTDMECVWEHLKEEKLKPKQLIIFTDGYVPSWGDPRYTETLFVIHSNKGCVAPYGQTIEYIY